VRVSLGSYWPFDLLLSSGLASAGTGTVVEARLGSARLVKFFRCGSFPDLGLRQVILPLYFRC
jgi:hypothetical protein